MSRALIEGLRRGIARIEERTRKPGRSRPATVERSSRNVGAPPSPRPRPRGDGAPRDAQTPGPRHLGIDGLTPLQRWEHTKARMEWSLEYAERAAASERARCAEAGRAADNADSIVEQVREWLRRHEAAKPSTDGEAS